MVMLTVKTIYYDNKFTLQVDMCPNHFFHSELVQFILFVMDHAMIIRRTTKLFQKCQVIFGALALKNYRNCSFFLFFFFFKEDSLYTLSDISCFLSLMKFQLLSFQQVPVSFAAIINVHVPYMYPLAFCFLKKLI